MSFSKKKPALMVIISAVLWGSYGSFVTAITGLGMSQNALVFIRMLITSLGVLLMILIGDRRQLRIHKKDIWLFIANGICSIVFFSLCYTAAINETKIATAAALLYTAPAIVMVLSAILFGEKLSLKKSICIFMSIAGCALVSGLLSGSGSALTTRGLLLGLGAGLGYALYSIFSRLILNRGYSVYTNIFYTFVVASAVFFVLSVPDFRAQNISSTPVNAILLAILCGIFTGFGSYVLYTSGMKKMETSRAAQLATIEPVTAAILGTVLFGQQLSLSEFIGIALVVLAVVLMNK